MDFIYNLQEPFNLQKTLFCGQTFRFTELENNIYFGIVNQKPIKIKQQDNTLIFYNTTKEEFYNFWYYYFDFNNNYSDILLAAKGYANLKDIVLSEQGIKILNQDPFETLISFIISQNNNIPRITKIINSLCQNFGTKIEGGYAFPTVAQLKNLKEEDLAVIRAGFRAKYIIDAVKKIESQEIILQNIMAESCDYISAKETLLKIKGVGPKVANCVLLFSLHHKCAFPEDVWIKRAVARLFKNGLPQELLGFAGVVQQYIFNYARQNPNLFK